MTESANDILTMAIVDGRHPVRAAINNALENPRCVRPFMPEGLAGSITTEILEALIKCDLGDRPSTDLRRQVNELKRENDGLVLALARLKGAS